MMRLVSGFAVVAALPMLLPAGVCAAASNTATTLFPLDGPNQLETRVILNCFKSDGHCDFTAGADMLTPDRVTGFPPGLWARQTTEIRSSNRLAYLDAHADGQYERVHKSMGSDEITTIYMGEAPGEVSDQRAHRLHRLADGATQDRQQRHRLHPHPGRLLRGQHHLAQHLRADHLLLISQSG